MADGLVEAENQKCSGMTTGILEAGSTGARTLPMASDKPGGGALPYKPIRDVPFFRVSFFSVNS